MVPLVTGAILPRVPNTCDGFKLKNLHNSQVCLSSRDFSGFSRLSLRFGSVLSQSGTSVPHR